MRHRNNSKGCHRFFRRPWLCLPLLLVLLVTVQQLVVLSRLFPAKEQMPAQLHTRNLRGPKSGFAWLTSRSRRRARQKIPNSHRFPPPPKDAEEIANGWQQNDDIHNDNDSVVEDAEFHNWKRAIKSVKQMMISSTQIAGGIRDWDTLRQCHSHDYDFLKSYKYLRRSGYATLKLHDSMAINNGTGAYLFLSTAEFYSNKQIGVFEHRYAERDFNICGQRFLCAFTDHSRDGLRVDGGSDSYYVGENDTFVDLLDANTVFAFSEPISHGCIQSDPLFATHHKGVLPLRKKKKSSSHRYSSTDKKPSFRRTTHHWLLPIECRMLSPLNVALNSAEISKHLNDNDNDSANDNALRKSRHEYRQKVERIRSKVQHSSVATDVSVTVFDVRSEIQPLARALEVAIELEKHSMPESANLRGEDGNGQEFVEMYPIPNATAALCSSVVVNSPMQATLSESLSTASMKEGKAKYRTVQRQESTVALKQKHRLAVCTMVHINERDARKRQSELNLVVQFVEYHLLQGVSHFYFYEHLFDALWREQFAADGYGPKKGAKTVAADGSETDALAKLGAIHTVTESREWRERHKKKKTSASPLLAVLRGYIEEGVATYVEWRSVPTVRGYPSFFNLYQDSQINSCLRRFKHEAQWLAAIDIDEWMLPVSPLSLSHIEKENPKRKNVVEVMDELGLFHDLSQPNKAPAACYFELWRHLATTCPIDLATAEVGAADMCETQQFDNFLRRSQCLMSQQMMLKFMLNAGDCPWHTAWNHFVEYFDWSQIEVDGDEDGDGRALKGVFRNESLWFANRDPIPASAAAFAKNRMTRLRATQTKMLAANGHWISLEKSEARKERSKKSGRKKQVKRYLEDKIERTDGFSKNGHLDESHALFDKWDFEHKWLAKTHNVIENIDSFEERIVLLHLSRHFDNEGFWQQLKAHRKMISANGTVDRVQLWKERTKRNQDFSHWTLRFEEHLQSKFKDLQQFHVSALLNQSALFCP